MHHHSASGRRLGYVAARAHDDARPNCPLSEMLAPYRQRSRPNPGGNPCRLAEAHG